MKEVTKLADFFQLYFCHLPVYPTKHSYNTPNHNQIFQTCRIKRIQ